MSALTRKLAGYIRTGNDLARGGVTFRSILLFPVRRRLPQRRNQLDLRNGISIVSPCEEPLAAMFKEIWTEHCYSSQPLRVTPASTIVDVGAHVGLFSLWAAVNFPEARLIAVEPSPRVCEFLLRNFESNGLRNARVVQCACAGRYGEAMLYSRGPEMMNSIFCRDSAGRPFRPLARVPTMPLNELFRRFEVRVCALLKLDCEGAEYEILFNAQDSTLGKIERMAIQYHVGLNNHTPDELSEFLKSHGFRVDCLPLLDEECGYLYAMRPTAVAPADNGAKS